MSGKQWLPSVDQRNGARMALILSQFISQAYTERLATAVHVVLTGCVFAFLAMMIALS
jgi:hypothetical protein